MADEQKDEKDEGRDSAPELENVPRKTVRKVLVTHLEAPPPSAKQEIHPRRPAPVVPTREERTGEERGEDGNAEKPASE